ncbi:hypothetical protein [Brevundimonas sp.]|uniref:hypothetical protein n=1 Tax=Brevundimonas sp. TaxID=1871086 RepID=UPI00261317FB|nr:hypothetical protein [Brevundimonas sp.]
MFAFSSSLKTGVLTACAAACLAVAAPAAAQDPLLDDFKTVCVTGDGSAAAAASSITAQGGWSPLDPAMFGAEAPFENLKAWMRAGGGGFQLAMTGDMTEPMEGMGSMEMNMGVCALGAQPGDYAALNRAISTWVGSGPQPDLSVDGNTGFLFALENGQVKPVDPGMTEEEIGLRMLSSGDLRMVMTTDQGGVVMVMYMVPKVQ